MMIWARYCTLAAIPLALQACAPDRNERNDTNVTDAGNDINYMHTAEALDEQVAYVPPNTIDLLKAGKPEACGAQDVKDTITKMTWPEKADYVKQAVWKRRTSSFRINYNLTTASGVDTSINEVSCQTTMEVRGGGFEREYRLTYTVAPSLDDPTNFVVSVDNLSGPKSFFFFQLAQAVRREEEQERQAIEEAAPVAPDELMDNNV